jgi:hypothetical protein
VDYSFIELSFDAIAEMDVTAVNVMFLGVRFSLIFGLEIEISIDIWCLPSECPLSSI